jgi:hypothetical protein
LRGAILITITSLLFTIPHLGNPEMARGEVWGALGYFGFGVFCAVITLQDQGLELALGVHAANNLFASVLVNSWDSVLPSQALFTYLDIGDNQWGFFFLLTQVVIFCAFVFARPFRGQVLANHASSISRSNL